MAPAHHLTITMTVWVRLSPGAGALLRAMAERLAIPHEDLARRLLEAAIEHDTIPGSDPTPY